MLSVRKHTGTGKYETIGEIEHYNMDAPGAFIETERITGKFSGKSEISKPEGLITAEESHGSLLESKEDEVKEVKVDEKIVKSLLLAIEIKDLDEDYDVATTNESDFVDNATVAIDTERTVDLEAQYNDFFKNNLTRAQQSVMREQIANGNVEVKCE